MAKVSANDPHVALAPENSSVKPAASPAIAPRDAKAPAIRPCVDYGPQRWLNLATAARYCSLNAKAIRTAIRRGEIPRRKIGKAFVIDARALDEWLEGEKVRQ
jgi:excisionase family DNA binding protein